MQGICFIEPMFKKVISEEKTQTRRIIPASRRARYQLNEILYLKEPYFVWEPEHTPGGMDKRFAYKYRAVKELEQFRKLEFELGYNTYYWHNKLFMPASHARYFIKIKAVGTQYLNDISKEDAIAEGFKSIADFQNTWISLHGFSSLSANPEVFVYEFELRVKI